MTGSRPARTLEMVETLGRYEIVKHLASGGMAQVLLARSTGIGGFERHVVVKRIHAEHAKDPRFVQMFLDEARLAALLHHVHIVQVHEVGDQAGTIFFAMEYVHGEDVRNILRELSKRREKTPLEHVVTIVSAAADALHHAHEQRGGDGKPLGLVHRDVSPANILVGFDGIVKVVDFGIAKAALRSKETQAGMLKGKVAYMAPEQCVGKPVDRRSDVYALGIVLYELACVRRLFKGDNEFLTMSSIVAGKIPPPTAHRPDLPKPLEQIIMKALANKPEDRFQTAAQMGDALEHFAADLGLRSSPKSLSTLMAKLFGSKREPWLVDDASDEPEITLTPDFDGSASGVVSPPVVALEKLAIPQAIEPTPSAPIMRARKKAITEKRNPAGAAKPVLPSPSTLAAKKPGNVYGVPITPRPGTAPHTGPTAAVAAPPVDASPAGGGDRSVAGALRVDDGWTADAKEPTSAVMPSAFAGGSVANASGAAPAIDEAAAHSALVATPVARSKPAWWRDRRAQIGGAGGVVALILVFAMTCRGKSSQPANEASAAPANEASPAAATAAPPAAPAEPSAPPPAAAAAAAAPPAAGSAAAPAKHASKASPSSRPHPASTATATKPTPTTTTTKGKRPKPHTLF